LSALTQLDIDQLEQKPNYTRMHYGYSRSFQLLWSIIVLSVAVTSCRQADTSSVENTTEEIVSLPSRTQYFPLSTQQVEDLPPKENFWIFLMAGQSNMAGRGQVLPEDTISHPRILTIDPDYHWILAKEPLNLFEPTMKGLDCGMAFAREMIQSVGDSIYIGIIHTAIGGSSIQQWLGDSLHREVNLLSNFREKAVFAQEHGTLKAILWHQGESDAHPDDYPLYEDKLKRLIEKFRSVAVNPEVPVILGELGRFDRSEQRKILKDSINKRIHSVAAQEEEVYVIDTGDLNPKSDSTHFDAPSQRIMGQRYAQKYLEIIPQ